MFHESGRKFSKWVENNVGKGEIAPTVFPTPFPPVFLKKNKLAPQTCENQGFFGNG